MIMGNVATDLVGCPALSQGCYQPVTVKMCDVTPEGVLATKQAWP